MFILYYVLSVRLTLSWLVMTPFGEPVVPDWKQNKTNYSDFQNLSQLHSKKSLQWRHNERYCVSNHRRLDCLPNHLFRCISKKTSKLRVTGLCEGKPPVTSGFPSQRASNTENVSINYMTSPCGESLLGLLSWYMCHIFRLSHCNSYQAVP